MMLHEVARPRTWDAVVGQDRAVGMLRALAARGAGGHAILLSGPPGTGKTTMALILARAFAPHDVREINGDTLTVEMVRTIEDSWRGKTLWGNRAIVVNEIHAITPRAVQSLLSLMECGRIPEDALLIGTTTRDPEDKQASLFGDEFGAACRSRWIRIRLTSQGLSEAFAKRAREVAAANGGDGHPESWYVRLVKDHGNNLREVLEAVEADILARGVAGA